MVHLLLQKSGMSSEHLKQCAKFSFGSIKLKKLELQHEVQEFNIIKEKRHLMLLESRQEQVLFEKLGEIRKQEIY